MDSLTCAPPPGEPLLRFLLLSPCPLRLLFAAVDAAFLLSLLLLLLLSLNKLLPRFFRKAASDRDGPGLDPGPLLPKPEARARTSLRFKLALAASALYAALYAALLVLAAFDRDRGVAADYLIFVVFRLLASSSAAAVVARERRSLASVHPLPLRLYWAASSVLVLLSAVACGVRYAAGGDLALLLLDGAVAVLSLPVSAILFHAAVAGSTGISLAAAAAAAEPEAGHPVTPYAAASWAQLLTWSWLNPLLTRGYRSPLKIEDVPRLAPQHEASRMLGRFEASWPDRAAMGDRPVRTALLRCFWPYLVGTGALSVAKLAVMYVGPSLVSNFVGYASAPERPLAEGLKLCGILLASKFFEVLSSHQYNFIAGNLGMLIRSTLITSLYKKGLKLSCSSRQHHGVGRIVNYMAVDAQQLADVMTQVHFLWLMPMQVAVALALLYVYLGVAVAAAVAGIVVMMGVVTVVTKKSNAYQFLLMGMRDRRMKAVNEMLNYMRVIKFQAWEDHFNESINRFRAGEYKWLSKFLYAFSFNMTALSSSSSVIAALCFGVSVACGLPLPASTVFTATSFFRLLGDPLRTFPQALISVSQALISLERLDSYFTAEELDEGAVERDEECGIGP